MKVTLRLYAHNDIGLTIFKIVKNIKKYRISIPTLRINSFCYK